MRATCREGSEPIACPSSSTEPDDGRSSLASPRSRVDLPQALAPTMTVTSPVGHVAGQVVDHGTVAVAQGHSRATSRLASVLLVGFHHDLLEVRPVASSHSRKGAPKAPVTTPTG